MIVAFNKNPLGNWENELLEDYSNDLENRVEDGFEATKIESGSNSNGRWTKFPDGTMICTRTVVYDMSNSNHLLELDSPQNFVGGNAVGSPSFRNASGNSSLNDWMGRIVVGFNNNRWRIAKSTTQTYSPTIDLIAIGRWK